jgi:putative aldouronate transport system permease protein
LGLRPHARRRAAFQRQWPLYVMVLPGIIFFLALRVVPLGGSVIAFQDYRITRGILASPWVGLKHFVRFFTYPDLQRVFWNTVIIACYNLVLAFPFPILLALLFNEVRGMAFRKTIQTVSYLPHFFSWVIVAGLTFDILSSTGFVNSLRGLLGREAILFMQRERYFRGIVVLTGIWKEAGWGTIIILAAISGIDVELYEAAVVDGAGRGAQAFQITLPLLFPTLVILFLLNVGSFLDLGFEHIFNLLTPMTFSVGDVLDTYVYRVGILEAQYSLTTAIGLFQSCIGFLLIFTCNRLSRTYLGGSLW